jgi:hypothetical protein
MGQRYKKNVIQSSFLRDMREEACMVAKYSTALFGIIVLDSTYGEKKQNRTEQKSFFVS